MKWKIFAPFAIAILFCACMKVQLFEKNVVIPKQQWDYAFKPSVQFNIEDTTAGYDLYVVVRHTDAYNYNNIWMNLYIQAPGEASTKQQLDIPLATNDKGWLGKGMDDIFEHRYKVTRQPIAFRKAGIYQFTMEQIMRENPLEHVLDVGLRVEKANP